MRRWRILVVEDDPLFRESLSMLLDEEGLDVVGASSAEEALRAAAETSFDLVVTDVRMPGMDGITMLDRMRYASPHTRAIVITGYAEHLVPVQAVRVHVDDFVTKPFDRRSFLTSIRRSLEWLEREAWWEATLRRSMDGAREVVEALLPQLHAPATDASERIRHQIAIAREAARRLGFSADRSGTVAWAAALDGLRDDAIGALRAQLTGGREDFSLGARLAHALDLAQEARRETPAEDDALALLRALRGGIAEAPPHVQEALQPRKDAEDAGELDETEGRCPPSLLALGLGYLHAGRAVEARDILSRHLAHADASSHACMALSLAEATCGNLANAVEAAEKALALAGGAVAEAEAQALLGALHIQSRHEGGETEVEEACGRLVLQGATRSEVRSLLLLAWAWSGRDVAPRFDRAVRRLLDRLEDARLEWALHADRWLAVQVLEKAERDGVEVARVRRVLQRLRAGEDNAEGRPVLRVDAFGGLRIRVGSREVQEEDWKTIKSKWLFVILLLHGGREVPDERLTDLLWESQDADRARKNLYSTLTYVRRALDPSGETLGDPVLHRRGRCQFNTALPYRVDFLAFESQARSGLAQWDAGQVPKAVPLLSSALDLYQGDLMENYDEEWIVPYRRQARERAILALEHLLSHHREQGDVASGLALAERLLAIDRCHQGACQHLMRLAIDSGQPERAARLYRACVRALQDDLHIAPSTQTTSIYHEILQTATLQARSS